MVVPLYEISIIGLSISDVKFIVTLFPLTDIELTFTVVAGEDSSAYVLTVQPDVFVVLAKFLLKST